MRPLPVHPLAGAPAFVAGVSMIRGQGVPVVNLALLLGGQADPPTRFVVVRAADRSVALAVDAVIGVAELPAEALAVVPPLLAKAAGDTVTGLGALDSQLLFVLQTACIVPDDVFLAAPPAGAEK